MFASVSNHDILSWASGIVFPARRCALMSPGHAQATFVECSITRIEARSMIIGRICAGNNFDYVIVNSNYTRSKGRDDRTLVMAVGARCRLRHHNSRTHSSRFSMGDMLPARSSASTTHRSSQPEQARPHHLNHSLHTPPRRLPCRHQGLYNKLGQPSHAYAGWQASGLSWWHSTPA